MKAILTVPEKDLTFPLENIEISIFTQVERKHNIETNMMEAKPCGEKITIVTSNMPKELMDAVHDLVSRFCNI